MADQPQLAVNAAPDNAGGRHLEFPAQGVPVIHRINRLGLWTLYIKEVRRFFKVQTQTIWAPAVTTLLYLMIFTVALGGGNRLVLGVPFAAFVSPGLIAMGIMNGAFANSSFYFLSGKIQGTIVDYLMPPLSELELMIALIGAAITRGVLVGLALTGAILLWPGTNLGMAHGWAIAWFGLMGAALLALVGLISSMWAVKFDHNAAVTNFVITPLTMLSGTFYVIDNLAPVFQSISRLNPFFYVISGFRFGFLGESDIGDTNMAVLHGAIALGLLNLVLGGVTYALLKRGWKLKS
ncbi:ABC transporter permease [Novosphingobium flavum]|uniref:Transport permease protein n=1 Tax=Novosphingobium flavum TaxID=1778672 RepID=A0A7X1FTL8_9SPHN|nr:ABC transporter permease [Novosphingobium flavum]MBC2666760.1 ABC transporter permease [Novosphingobium flavum]